MVWCQFPKVIGVSSDLKLTSLVVPSGFNGRKECLRLICHLASLQLLVAIVFVFLNVYDFFIGQLVCLNCFLHLKYPFSYSSSSELLHILQGCPLFRQSFLVPLGGLVSPSYVFPQQFIHNVSKYLLYSTMGQSCFKYFIHNNFSSSQQPHEVASSLSALFFN